MARAAWVGRIQLSHVCGHYVRVSCPHVEAISPSSPRNACPHSAPKSQNPQEREEGTLQSEQCPDIHLLRPPKFCRDSSTSSDRALSQNLLPRSEAPPEGWQCKSKSKSSIEHRGEKECDPAMSGGRPKSRSTGLRPKLGWPTGSPSTRTPHSFSMIPAPRHTLAAAKRRKLQVQSLPCSTRECVGADVRVAAQPPRRGLNQTLRRPAMVHMKAC